MHIKLKLYVYLNVFLIILANLIQIHQIFKRFILITQTFNSVFTYTQDENSTKKIMIID